jgi:hypothetical protein
MTSRWVPDDGTALLIPADAEQLRCGGPEFLTAAFRGFGALRSDDAVAAITEFTECDGGSTGRKLLLGVDYADPENGSPTELFVKFSRDFDNPRRDRGKTQMDLEVGFAQLCRDQAVPVTVPSCLFAGYHRGSGTGLLITERIPYGTAPVERHYDKCLDYQMPEPLAHYRALLTSVARLAGAHKAGHLGPNVSRQFAFDPERVTVGARVPYTDDQLRDRVYGYGAFATSHRGLLPRQLCTAEFVDRIAEEVVAVFSHHDTVTEYLNATADHVALCHWNANVDNAWFWTAESGVLECGLMDWGCVSEMNVAMALWGSLCGAESDVWERHLDSLLEHFVDEYAGAGGPVLDVEVLRRQIVLYATVMGVAWLLDAPIYLRAAVPDLAAVTDRYDPRISGNEVARTQLRMLTNFLGLWATHDVAGLLTEVDSQYR